MAAQEKGVDVDIARLAFADGAMGMIDAWFASIDAAMLDALPAEGLSALSIRRRIIALVEARLALLASDRDALRRALAILAMPTHVVQAGKLGWRAADAMWRAAGDSTTDLNHYSKRITLSAVYASTLLVFVNDDSADHADSRAFLARRVAEGELAIADPALAAAQFVDLSQSTLMRPRLFNAERMPPSEDEIAYVVGEAVTTFMARYGVKAA